jgi:hypothetical protein
LIFRNIIAFIVVMKTVSLSAMPSFQSTTTIPTDVFFSASYRKAIYRAYSLAAKPNAWASCRFNIEKNVVYLETFYPNGCPHRAIAMWRKPQRDNDGFLFSVHTFGRTDTFRTQNLRHALGNFQSVRPELKLAIV